MRAGLYWITMVPLPLTWNEWGAILVPIYLFLVLWIRWAVQSIRPSRPKPKTKGVPE